MMDDPAMPIQPRHPISAALRLALALAAATALAGCPQSTGQQQGGAAATSSTPTANPAGDARMARELSEQQIEQIFNAGQPVPAFDPRRSVAQLSQCARWEEPAAPDAISQSWYRAATTLNATRRKTAEQYQQMLILYEAAARRGHYRAMMHLTVLYSDGERVEGNLRYPAEPDKARLWIHEGLRREWPGALEWLSTALHQGSAGYRRNEAQSLAYLQLAADLGSALAQLELGKHYDDALKFRDKGVALYNCAAAQGSVSAANRQMAIIKEIRGYPTEALQNYQQAVMSGGEGGGRSAFSLLGAFASREPDQDQIVLGTFYDPVRINAYKDLWAVLEGKKDSQGVRHDANPFLRFPRLNEVLPLPPAKVTEWRGIYSAMSPEDAQYYQNPPPAQYYIDEIRRSGYMVPEGYLRAPVPIPQGE